MLSRPHWPVGRDGLTGQGAFAYAGTLQDAQAAGMLAVAIDSAREKCGCSLLAAS